MGLSAAQEGMLEWRHNTPIEETSMKRAAIILTILSLAVLACSFSFDAFGGGDNTDGGEDTSSGEPQGSSVLFQDDFSDVNSGWDRAESEFALTDYQGDGSYHIAISTENYGAWTNPYRSFTDVSVQVDTALQGGGEDNAFGIICRYADIDNFYVGMISSDGYYGFFQRNGGGGLEFLNMEAMLFSDAINLGGANNRVRLDCVGNTLTLYVNGVLLDSTADSRLSSGDVGLYAKTFSDASTDVVFDNFVVTQP